MSNSIFNPIYLNMYLIASFARSCLFIVSK